MIVKAEIVSQPYSGEYDERIYDIPNPWNSPKWTWVKFQNEDFIDWCGEFRGEHRNVAISEKYNIVLVLTSDYLYKLDRLNGGLINHKYQPQYHNLTVTPDGEIIVADYYSINLLEPTLEGMKEIESPIKMDMIKFHGWLNKKLLISCDVFLNWSKHAELELDGETLEITIKNYT